MKEKWLENRLLLIALLAIATLVVYFNSMHGTWHFDDKQHLIENVKIRGWDGWRQMLAIEFRAFLWLTFWLNYQLCGYKPFGWHVVNLAMHLVNVFLVYALVKDFFRERGPQIAFGAALLFAIHPIQTESVTYIISRSELMAANFYLGSLLCWAVYRRSSDYGKNPWSKPALGSLACFLIGLFTKESVITLPAVLVAWEFFLPATKDRKILSWKRWQPFIPAFLFFGLWMLYRFQVQGGTIGNPDLEEIEHGSTYPWTETRVIWIYLRLLLAPIHQNIDPDVVASKSVWEPIVLLAITAHAAVLGFAFWLRKRQPVLGLAIVWFYLTVATTSSFFALRDVMAEHRVYLSSVGFFIVLAWAMLEVLPSRLPKKHRQAAWILFFVLCFTYAGATIHRNRVYQDGRWMWENVLQGSPHKSRPHYNLGNAYFNAGQFDLAIEHYTQSLVYKPDNMASFFNRGNAYNRTGKWEQALVDYREVVHLKPDFYQGWYNLGVVLGTKGRDEEARDAYEHVVQVNPAFPDVYNAIGVTWLKTGNEQKAIPYFEKALARDPEQFDATLNLGISYLSQKNYRRAADYFERAVRLHPLDPKALLSLAHCQVKLQMDPRQTRVLLERVAGINPAYRQHKQFQELEQDLRKRL